MEGVMNVAVEVMALAVGIACGACAYLGGYVTGNPVEVAVQLIVALFGANLIHDKVASPVASVLNHR